MRSPGENPSRRRLLGTLLGVFVAAVFALVQARPAFARPFDVAGSDWEGCAELVRLARAELGDARIVATDRVDLSALRPEDSLILLHPERALDAPSLGRFMRAGGRIVLLDDFGTGEGLLEHFGMERVPAPKHPADALRHNPSLAIAEPASAHPVVTDVTRVVTNHPTGLRHPDLSPVLKIRATGGEQDVVVAVAGAVGQGRLLAVSDPSIVINSMLRYPGNKTFTRALVRYAGDDDVWGKRGGKIYVAAGAFELRGSYGEESSFFAEWNDRVRAVQDALSSLRHDGVPAWLAFVVAVLVGLGVVVWVGSNAGRVHKPTAPRFTRSIPVAAQGGVAGHAAVIGAEKTSRALAMLELKAALEEELCRILDLEVIPSTDALLLRIKESRLLEPEASASLKQLLSRMASLETMVLSRRGGPLTKVPDGEVVLTAATIRSILDQARSRAAARGASAA